jgi:hypothetical protein
MIDPNLITTKSVGELPTSPLTVDSVIPHELTGDLYQGTIQQLLQLLRPLVGKLQFEIVQLDVNTQYVLDNFDETGLGRNLCEGFALCNGNNGTKNRDGRTSIAYGTTFNFPGAFNGNASHTLTEAQMPNHSHFNGIADNDNVIFVYGGVTNGLPGLATGSVQSENTPRTNQGRTSQVGSNQPFSLMNPSIVTVTMMKL